MRNKTAISSIILLVFLYFPLFPQTHTSVPLGNQIYYILEQAEIRGLCSPLPGTRPYTRSVVISAINEILDSPDTKKLTTVEREILEQYLEKYSKQINIEAGVTIDMARRHIFPAVSAYAAQLARDALSLAAINAVSAPQEKRAKEIAELASELYQETAGLETLLTETQGIGETLAQARAYSGKVRPAMDAVRSKADALEKLVSKDAWPFPGYEELLFKL